VTQLRRKPTFRWLSDLEVLLPLGGGLIFGAWGYGVGTPIDFNRAICIGSVYFILNVLDLRVWASSRLDFA
jgi:hypothetical protein